MLSRDFHILQAIYFLLNPHLGMLENDGLADYLWDSGLTYGMDASHSRNHFPILVRGHRDVLKYFLVVQCFFSAVGLYWNKLILKVMRIFWARKLL